MCTWVLACNAPCVQAALPWFRWAGLLKDAEHYLSCRREMTGAFSNTSCYQMNLPTMVPGGWVVALASHNAIERSANLEPAVARQCQHYSIELHDGLFCLPPWLLNYH